MGSIVYKYFIESAHNFSSNVRHRICIRECQKKLKSYTEMRLEYCAVTDLNYVIRKFPKEKIRLISQQTKMLRMKWRTKKLIKLIAISSFSECFIVGWMLFFPSLFLVFFFFALTDLSLPLSIMSNLCTACNLAPILIHFYFDRVKESENIFELDNRWKKKEHLQSFSCTCFRWGILHCMLPSMY